MASGTDEDYDASLWNRQIRSSDQAVLENLENHYKELENMMDPTYRAQMRTWHAKVSSDKESKESSETEDNQ